MNDLTNMDRRRFLGTAAAAAVVAVGTGAGVLGLVKPASAEDYPLPPLPFPENALEPVISAETVSFHYGKHTAGYYRKINNMVAGTRFEGRPLIDVVMETSGDSAYQNIFNNAAQSLNHTLYWQCVTPGGPDKPQGELAKAIKNSFGSCEYLKKMLAEAGGSQFGSGWAWLAQDGRQLKVVRTPNAVTPLVMGYKPLLTMDVWEHAYYLDYQNRRGDYMQGFLDKLINWDIVAGNMNP